MENKREVSQFVNEEARALKDKETGKSYSISDFTFRFKRNGACKKEFKELVVNFLYKNEEIAYYCFVDANLNNIDAVNAAKEQIKRLISDGGITLYAKKYYQKFYKK